MIDQSSQTAASRTASEAGWTGAPAIGSLPDTTMEKVVVLPATTPPSGASAGPEQDRQRRPLLAFASMTGPAAKALRPVDARRVERILRRLGTLWESRALDGNTFSIYSQTRFRRAHRP